MAFIGQGGLPLLPFSPSLSALDLRATRLASIVKCWRSRTHTCSCTRALEPLRIDAELQLMRGPHREGSCKNNNTRRKFRKLPEDRRRCLTWACSPVTPLLVPVSQPRGFDKVGCVSLRLDLASQAASDIPSCLTDLSQSCEEATSGRRQRKELQCYASKAILLKVHVAIGQAALTAKTESA